MRMTAPPLAIPQLIIRTAWPRRTGLMVTADSLLHSDRKIEAAVIATLAVASIVAVQVLAFTLIEFFIVLAIVVVVAAFAIPAWKKAQTGRNARLVGPASLQSGVEGTYTYTLGQYKSSGTGALVTPEPGTSTVFTLTFDETKVTGTIVTVSYVSGGSVTGDSGLDSGNIMVAPAPSTQTGSATSGTSRSGVGGVTSVVISGDGDGKLTLVGTSGKVSVTKLITITP